jgi:catechol 2,3-dioxygenase-like lactoylglutathione lyase family enzyme
MVTTMKIRALVPVLVLGLTLSCLAVAQTSGSAELPPPVFHHLHLNSTNPDAAIDFYTKQFPSTSKSTWGGFPALKTGDVYVLFNKVNKPPLLEPQTAIWHFGWHVVDVREDNARYLKDKVTLLPLYTGEGDASVWVSSDTWPGTAGTLGRTKEQIAEAKAQGIRPRGGAGFAYLEGPDHAIIEYQGNMPKERFNHVHMFHDNPFCAQLWYEEHLEAHVGGRGRGPQHTEANCKVEHGELTFPSLTKGGMYRSPGAGVSFGDVTLPSYIRPGDKPLASTRGHLADHFALAVTSLDPWIAKLKREKVKFLIAKPYKLGNDGRAVMIEGPSHEAIELVEVNK